MIRSGAPTFIRSRFLFVLSVVSAFFLAGITVPAQSATSTNSISLMDISVSSVAQTSLSPVRHQVVIKGKYTNSTSQYASPVIELLVGNSLSSRSAVIAAVSNENFPGLTAHPEIFTKLSGLAPAKSQDWQLVFDGDQFVKNDDAVVVFGAQVQGTQEQVAITHPWFYKDAFKPTQIVVAATLTTTTFHPVDQPVDVAIGTNEIDRLNNLLDVLPANALVVVDPYLRDWLKDFSYSDLSEKSAQLLERLSKYDAYESVYAQTNIAKTVANKLSTMTTSALTSKESSVVVYAPSNELVSKTLFKKVSEQQDSLIVLPNESLGGVQETINAHGITNGTDFLVSDSGLSRCFTFNDQLLARSCLTSLLAAITAESPNRSRTVLLNLPINAYDAQALSVISHADQFNNVFSSVDVDTALATSPVIHSIPQGTNENLAVTTAMRKGLAQLSNLAKSVDSVFKDEALSRQLNATRYFALSTLNTAEKENLDIVQSAVTYANDQLHTLSLEGSSRITIPGTKSSLPITIVNGSDHTATVGVQISSSLPGRISAANIDVVTIEPGKRMTVQIPISVSGAGLIPVEATLTSRDNDSFGKSLSIQIASSAYQDIARNLVWTALALLVLLLANSLRKRRRTA